LLKVLPTGLADIADLTKPTLLECYPNPFNPTTTITYYVPSPFAVSVTVYNLLGQEVRTLVTEFATAGLHNIVWDGRDNSGLASPSGVYLARFTAGTSSIIKKMILAK
jgi:flagellar hook assembly protein FlgD